MERKLIANLFFLLVISLQTNAQEMKYGKITKAEKELTFVAFEPDADAVVLEENSFNSFNGGILHNHYHKRVKILKESGTEHGNIRIRYFSGNNGIQNVNKISAQLVNFDGDNEEVVKLSKADFYYVDGENGWKEVRFTFPEVRPGSILEYEYNMQDKGITFLDSWIFQNQIPTLKSTYSISIPSYLNYRLMSQGEQVLKTSAKQYDGVYKWTLNDLHSIKEEPFMTNYQDYLEKLDFQLAGYVSSSSALGAGRSFKETYTSWQELSDFIFESDRFGSYLKPSKSLIGLFYNATENSDKLSKAKAVYSYVQNSIKFNNWQGYYPTQDLKSLLEKKQGSRADINLLLLAQLRANDISAVPFMISSKGNGRSHLLDSPFLDQFNQLLVLAEIEGKEYFLDASNENYPFGYLPLYFHVSQGYALRDKNSGLIPVTQQHRSGINQVGNIKVNESGKLQSQIHLRFSEYDAISQAISKVKLGDDDFKKEIFNKTGEFFEVTITEKYEPKRIMDISVMGQELELGQDLLMVSPFNYVRWSENPLKADYRTFPIDMLYAFNDMYSTVIEIPEDYELDDFPEPVEVMLPSNIASFSYKVEPIGGTIKVSSSINFKHSLIPAGFYPELKYFFGLVTSKLQEPIILKKSAVVAD